MACSLFVFCSLLIIWFLYCLFPSFLTATTAHKIWYHSSPVLRPLHIDSLFFFLLTAQNSVAKKKSWTTSSLYCRSCCYTNITFHRYIRCISYTRTHTYTGITRSSLHTALSLCLCEWVSERVCAYPFLRLAVSLYLNIKNWDYGYVSIIRI